MVFIKRHNSRPTAAPAGPYRIAALALALLASSPASQAASAAPSVTLERHPLYSCAGGVGYVATFNFGDPEYRKNHEVVVLGEGFKRAQEAVEALRAKGYRPVALINGGYFGSNGEIYSYFKSSALGRSLPRNSALSPRACATFSAAADERLPALEFTPSTDEAYRAFVENRDNEVFCAGPQLVRDSRNVAADQYCKEKFGPGCRPDGGDSGVGFSRNLPRSASCVTAGGAIKFFMFNSAKSLCGTTLPKLTEIMLKAGCVSGMNHDGGGSSKLFVDLGEGVSNRYLYSLGAESARPIPVWVAVVERKQP